MLLSFCAENNLTITNTLFHQADKYKTTWMHHRSKQWHLIDSAICRVRDMCEVRITRVMRGSRVLDWPPPRQVYLVAAHYSDASQDCEILQASFRHCKTEAAGTQSHVCEGPRQQTDYPRTTVWTPTSTVGRVQDSGDWVSQADHWAKKESPSGLVQWERRTHQRTPGRQKESLHRVAEWHLLHFKAWPLQTNSKGRPRRHFTECRMSGGRRRPTKLKRTLPQRTQKCSSVPSRKSTALPSHAPRRSCQLMANPA